MATFSLPMVAVFDLVRRVFVMGGGNVEACLWPTLASVMREVNLVGDPKTSASSSTPPVSSFVGVERTMGKGNELVGRSANRFPPPGEGGRPVEGMLKDLVFFIGERSRLSMDDDEGCRLEGDIGVGGAVGSATIGAAGDDAGDIIISAPTSTSDSAESDDGREDSSDDKEETDGERMRVDCERGGVGCDGGGVG